MDHLPNLTEDEERLFHQAVTEGTDAMRLVSRHKISYNILRQHKNDILILFIFLCLVLTFFWRVIFLREVWYVIDHSLQNYPFRAFFADGLKQGKLHLWCPYIYSGFPLFAESQTGFAYPFNLIFFFLFPTSIAYHYGMVFHYFLAGLFMYLFLRQIRLQRASSFFGAAAFMFSGFMVTRLLHVNIINVAVWLPLILFFIERGFETWKKHNFVYAGLSLGIQFLAGYFPVSLYILLGFSLYFVAKTVFVFSEKRSKQVLAMAIVFYLIVLVVGFGIGAIQLIPMYELSRMSFRSHGMTYDVATTWSMPIQQLITILIPDFYGNPMKNTWGPVINYWEICMYMGILPLLFIFPAFAFKRDKYACLYGGFALLYLLLAMGSHTPLYRLLYALPVYNSVRIPSRLLYLFSFWMIVLSALGLDRLLTIDRNREHKLVRTWAIVLITIAIAIALFWVTVVSKEPHVVKFLSEHSNIRGDDIYNQFSLNITQSFIVIALSIGLIVCYCLGRMTNDMFAFTACVLLIVDLFLFGMSYNRTTNRQLYKREPKVFQLLERDKELFRVVLKDRPNMGNTPMLWKFYSADGWSPLCIERYGRLIGAKNLRGWNAEFVLPTPRALELTNVKYVIAHDRKLDENRQFELIWTGDENVYKNKEFLPRAFITHSALVIRDSHQMLAILRKKDFVFQEIALLEEEPHIQLQDIRTTPNASSWVKVEEYLPQEIIIRAKLDIPGLLVLTDAYYPGWKAYVDDTEQKIYRAYYVFKAVPLKKGEHMVRFVYEPISFKLGDCCARRQI